MNATDYENNLVNQQLNKSLPDSRSNELEKNENWNDFFDRTT